MEIRCYRITLFRLYSSGMLLVNSESQHSQISWDLFDSILILSTMKNTIVTDLDYMVGLGHSEKDVREALKITKGNRNAALYILVKGSTKSDLAWRNDNPDDWVHGVDTLPNIAENRALYISPVYIYAESYYPTDDLTDYKYKLKISMKDGRHWKIAKTYSEFRNFKSSLPFGTTFMFTNSFPMPILGYGEQSKSFLDGRLATLAEWIRELVMNNV